MRRVKFMERVFSASHIKLEGVTVFQLTTTLKFHVHSNNFFRLAVSQKNKDTSNVSKNNYDQ